MAKAKVKKQQKAAKAKPSAKKKGSSKPGAKALGKGKKPAAKAKGAAGKKPAARKPAPKKQAPAKPVKKVAAKPAQKKSAKTAAKAPAPKQQKTTPAKPEPKVTPPKGNKPAANTPAPARPAPAPPAAKAAAPAAEARSAEAPAHPGPAAAPKKEPAPKKATKEDKVKAPIVAVMTGLDPIGGPARTLKRAVKERFMLEFYMNATPGSLYDMLSTPSGLSEWFCDDVDVRGDQFTFRWGNDDQSAQCLSRKFGELMRFQWEDDEDQGSYFELRIRIDPMTNETCLVVTDHAWPKDLEEAKALWGSQIHTLQRVLGA